MSYIQLNRESKILDWIIEQRPTAYVLLTLIARRAKRTLDHPDKRLEIGESFIGDFKSYGVNRQVYRTDLDFLISNQLVTTKVTNKGTIAKLISTDIFDINIKQVTNKLTRNQPSTNHQLTTNNNDKNEKSKEVSINQTEIIDYWNNKLGKKFRPSLDLETNINYWLKAFTLDEIKLAISNIPTLAGTSDFWRAMRPQLFFRQSNKLGEADYIETALNTDKPKGNTSDELINLMNL